MISPAWVHAKIGAVIEIRLSHDQESREFKSGPLQQPGRSLHHLGSLPPSCTTRSRYALLGAPWEKPRPILVGLGVAARMTRDYFETRRLRKYRERFYDLRFL